MSEGIGPHAFVSYLKEKKSLWIIAVILALGIVMMMLGSTDNKGTADDTELRVKELCEKIEGVNDVHVMVVYKKDDVGGIAVVCEGGGNAAIRLKLTELLTSLFGIPSGAVSVVGGK